MRCRSNYYFYGYQIDLILQQFQQRESSYMFI